MDVEDGDNQIWVAKYWFQHPDDSANSQYYDTTIDNSVVKLFSSEQIT